MTIPGWLSALEGAALLCYLAALAAHVHLFALARQRPTPATSWTLWAGFALHSLALLARGRVLEFSPIFGMHGAFSFIAWSLALCYVFLQGHLRSSSPGVFLLPFVVVFAGVAFVAGRVVEAPPELEQMRASGVLFSIHMAAALFSYSCFAIAFAGGLMYLLQDRELHEKRLGYFYRRMPPLEVVEHMNTHAMGLGLALLSVGIVSGAMGLSAADDVQWADNAKVVTAVVVWAAYAFNLFMIMRGQWRGRRGAIVSIACFCLVFVFFFGVKLLFAGVHGRL